MTYNTQVSIKIKRKMIVDHEWRKPVVKPYFHLTKLSSAHVSPDCIEKSVEYMESIGTDKMD